MMPSLENLLCKQYLRSWNYSVCIGNDLNTDLKNADKNKSKSPSPPHPPQKKKRKKNQFFIPNEFSDSIAVLILDKISTKKALNALCCWEKCFSFNWDAPSHTWTYPGVPKSAINIGKMWAVWKLFLRECIKSKLGLSHGNLVRSRGLAYLGRHFS